MKVSVQSNQIETSNVHQFSIFFLMFQFFYTFIYTGVESFVLLNAPEAVKKQEFAEKLVFVSLVSVALGWLADSYVHKLKIIAACMTCSFALSVGSIFFSNVKTYPWLFHLSILYVYFVFLASVPVMNSYYFEQAKFKQTDYTLDTLLFVWVWCRFLMVTVFTSFFRIIIQILGYAFLCAIFSLMISIALIGLIISLFQVAKFGFKSPVMNLSYTALMYGISTVRYKIRNLIRMKNDEIDLLYQPNVRFMCKRFWTVSFVGIFAIFLGHLRTSTYIAANYVSLYLFGEYTNTVLTFQSYYGVFTVTSFPLYYYALKRFNFFRYDLRLIGVGKGVIIASLLYFTILSSKLDSQQCPLPMEGYSQVRIYNILDSPTNVITTFSKAIVEPASSILLPNINVNIYGPRTSAEIYNKKQNIHNKSAINIEEGKSLSYYVGNQGLQFFGVEPLPVKHNLIEDGKDPRAFYLFPGKEVKVYVKYEEGRLIPIARVTPNSTNYTDIIKGKFNVLVTTSEKNVTFNSNFESYVDYVYAILLYNLSSVDGVIIFTVKNPRVITGFQLLLAGILYGMGMSILFFHSCRFFASNIPPPLLTFLMSLMFFMQYIPTLTYLEPIYSKKLHFDIKYIHLNITISLIFLITYVSWAMKYKPYIFTTFSSDAEVEMKLEKSRSLKDRTPSFKRETSEANKHRP